MADSGSSKSDSKDKSITVGDHTFSANKGYGEWFFYNLLTALDTPATYIRENFVERFRKEKPKYYHRQYRRVPTIDECYTDDQACIFEADQQLQRDKLVDDKILLVLYNRYMDCCYAYGEEKRTFCTGYYKNYFKAKEMHQIKYGDLGPKPNARMVYMKQKHRLIHERRKAEGKEFTIPPPFI